MNNRKCDYSLGRGIYFEPSDHAGIFRRTIAATIDLTIIMLLLVLLAVLFYFVFTSPTPQVSAAMFAIWTIASWLYLTAIKSSKLRTIGYRLMGIKIIDYKGGHPSIARMTIRLMLMLIGPFNPISDLLWTGADPNGRSLRDCYTGTHVLRINANPIGFGSRFMLYYTGLGCTITYPSVSKSE